MVAVLSGWREAGFAIQNSKLRKRDENPGRTIGHQKVGNSGPGKGGEGGDCVLGTEDGDRIGWTRQGKGKRKGETLC